MTSLRAAVGELYRQIAAPAWASPNLDGLLDILRDLSWQPPGPVEVTVPAGLTAPDAARLDEALATAVRETAGSARPVRVVRTGG